MDMKHEPAPVSGLEQSILNTLPDIVAEVTDRYSAGAEEVSTNVTIRMFMEIMKIVALQYSFLKRSRRSPEGVDSIIWPNRIRDPSDDLEAMSNFVLQVTRLLLNRLGTKCVDRVPVLKRIMYLYTVGQNTISNFGNEPPLFPFLRVFLDKRTARTFGVGWRTGPVGPGFQEPRANCTEPPEIKCDFPGDCQTNPGLNCEWKCQNGKCVALPTLIHNLRAKTWRVLENRLTKFKEELSDIAPCPNANALNHVNSGEEEAKADIEEDEEEEPPVCPICLQRANGAGPLGFRCTHPDQKDEVVHPETFHEECLDRWVQNRNICPFCNEKCRVENDGMYRRFDELLGVALGPDHAPYFTSRVEIEGFEPQSGDGSSKRAAEQAAASAMLLREGVWEEPPDG